MPVQPIFSDALHIRHATEHDASVVYEFICTLEEVRLNQATFNSIFHQNLTSPSIYYIVAEWAGEVVGFVSCHVQQLLHHGGKVGEIQELFVRPDVRNHQIGHQLIATLSALAADEGFINLEVTTNQKRADTVRFYERESFKQTHFKLVKPIKP